MMIASAEEVKDPIDYDREKCIESGDDTKPPWNDETAHRAFRHIHHAAGNILRREVRIFKSLDGFAGFCAFELLAKLSRRWSWINAADLDAKRPDLAAKPVGKGTHAIFAGGIGCDERRGDETCDRRHVDDVTFSTLEHVRQNFARDQHGTDQIHLDDCFDIAFGVEFFEPIHTAVA